MHQETQQLNPHYAFLLNPELAKVAQWFQGGSQDQRIMGKLIAELRVKGETERATALDYIDATVHYKMESWTSSELINRLPLYPVEGMAGFTDDFFEDIRSLHELGVRAARGVCNGDFQPLIIFASMELALLTTAHNSFGTIEDELLDPHLNAYYSFVAKRAGVFENKFQEQDRLAQSILNLTAELNLEPDNDEKKMQLAELREKYAHQGLEDLEEIPPPDLELATLKSPEERRIDYEEGKKRWEEKLASQSAETPVRPHKNSSNIYEQVLVARAIRENRMRAVADWVRKGQRLAKGQAQSQIES